MTYTIDGETTLEPGASAKLSFGMPESARIVRVIVGAWWSGGERDGEDARESVTISGIGEVHDAGVHAPWIACVYLRSLDAFARIRCRVTVEYTIRDDDGARMVAEDAMRCNCGLPGEPCIIDVRVTFLGSGQAYEFAGVRCDACYGAIVRSLERAGVRRTGPGPEGLAARFASIGRRGT